MNTPKEKLVEQAPSERQISPHRDKNFRNRRAYRQKGAVGFAPIKFGVFVAVASVIAAVAYFGAQEFLLNEDDASDGRRAVAIQRGTLLDEVTASGSVSFPELESLRFEISGTVADVLVEEGEAVTAGQELILLDDVTISALEAAVASAELALQDAGDNLANLLSGATGLERAIAVSNLADARVKSMNAASDLAEFTSEGSSDSPATASAKDGLSDANEALADAIAVSDDDAQAQDELVEDAREVYDEAAAEFSDLVGGWFGAVVTEEDRALSPTDLVSKWGITIDEIISTSLATTESPQDDLSTPWNEAVVWVWTHLTPYPILTDCDTTSFTARCPATELDEAWDVTVAADEVLVEAIDDAKIAAKAQQVLIDAAQSDVEAAAEDVVATVNDIEINALAATLAEKIELEKDAESTIDELNDLDALRINLATTSVNQANAALQNAISELAAANLVAPFDGVIASISVEIGDPVNRQTQTIDILDPSVVTIDGTVDEIDVLSLSLGDTVSVLLDALPDQPLEGVIDEIGEGSNQQGVIQFPLTISLTPPDGIELIEGLSATASIVLNQIDDAILVPLQAVGGSFTQATVDVVTPDGFVTTNIELGASDDFWVVVESGLSEGQEVLMAIAESVDPFQQLFGGGGGAIRVPGVAGGGGATFSGGGGGGGGGRR
jgi:RND family efflux transporter MFP subunit